MKIDINVSESGSYTYKKLFDFLSSEDTTKVSAKKFIASWIGLDRMRVKEAGIGNDGTHDIIYVRLRHNVYYGVLKKDQVKPRHGKLKAGHSYMVVTFDADGIKDEVIEGISVKTLGDAAAILKDRGGF